MNGNTSLNHLQNNTQDMIHRKVNTTENIEITEWKFCM